GLGADANNPAAIARVYAVKGRPANHPLIVHVLDTDAARQWCDHLPDYAERLAATYWPGPLTLVLPKAAQVSDALTGGQGSIALRVPTHPAFRAVLQHLAQRPQANNTLPAGIAAPSANRFGRVSPTTADHVRQDLGAFLTDNDVILDGGPCTIGVESTIVDCTGPQPVILRTGHISAEQIRTTTGLPLATHSTVRAPGTLAAHYAPTARVILTTPSELPPPKNPADKDPTEGLLALAPITTPPGMVRLAAPADVDDYARMLYAALREADALQLTTIWAIPPTGSGLAEAIRDRLTRAAADFAPTTTSVASEQPHPTE
ncbi:MAG: L-threonylcarbamoyladenylate synthase, partial [Actinomycetales bacterium]